MIIVFLLCLMGCHAAFAQTPVNQDMNNVAEQVRGSDDSSSGFVADVLTWYDAHMNYWAVGLLMTLESSFIPFPSEVVIPPAVYVASNPDTRSGMSLWIIVLVGTLGALIGAYINYFLSRWLGRPIISTFAVCSNSPGPRSTVPKSTSTIMAMSPLWWAGSFLLSASSSPSPQACPK